MMKKTVAGLVLIVAFLSAWSSAPREAAAQASTSTALTVVTYNIRYENTGDGENGWPNRREAMAGYLTAAGADLIGLQEVLPQQRAYLAEHLAGYAWYGVGRNAEHDQGEGVPIFYRRDRFDVLDKGTFWLSATPGVPGSRGWDAALPRVTSWLKLRDRRSGRELLMVNTHYDHRGPEARLESSRLMLQEIDRLAATGGKRVPVILTGDLNCRPSDAPYRALVEAGDAASRLIDAQQLSRTPHQGGDSTSNGFKAIAPGAKIDHILVRDVAGVASHRIEDPRIDGRFVSDHQPIVAVLDMADAR